ncbi:MAG TPA: hypothetical protein PK095_05565, partial [Myxococcota bacterium]|nr:hypothetical protein [Myxococcota bacterium]
MSQSSASVVDTRKSEPRKEEAPPSEQRDGLRTLLRGLSFAQQEDALKPASTPPPGAPPHPPKGLLARLMSLVPMALEGIGDTEVVAREKGPGPSPERPKEDGAEKESKEVEEAEELLDESDAPDEPPEQVEADNDAEAETEELEHDEAPELVEEMAPPEVSEAPTAPVQMKAKPGAKKAPAKPAPKAAPKPAAKKAAPKAAPKPAAKKAA